MYICDVHLSCTFVTRGHYQGLVVREFFELRKSKVT